MMEEANEDQPEMVSHEEAMLAEKEATQNLSATQSMGTALPLVQSPPTLSAPSPLPAFLSKTAMPASPQSPPSKTASKTMPVPSSTPSATRVTTTKAPESPQIPHEGMAKASDVGEMQQAGGGAGNGGQTLFGWLSGNSLVSKVMERTKSSMESVITTLDPGMKEIMNSGGDIDVAVTSTKDNKVIPVREAFQNVFGKATVIGKASQATTAAQPVGFTAGLKGAEERIANLRKNGSIPEDMTVVSVEGFIVELLPDKWFEVSCLVLKDSIRGIELQTFSQPTLIPTEYVLTAQDKTPADYPLRWAGLSVTIGEVIETAQPHIGHADWQMVLSGVGRRQSLLLAAQSLAFMYKQKLPTSFIS